MKYTTVYDENQNKICDIHKLAWNITKKGMPFSFLGGYIIMSYQCDPNKEHGFFAHMIDSLKTWWSCRKSN